VLVFHDLSRRKRNQEARTQLARRDSLLRLARRFAAQSDAEQVYTDLLDEAIAVLGGDGGTLTRLDPLEGVLVPVRASVAENVTISVGKGINGRAAERRAPVILNDYQREFGDTTAPARAGVRAAVGVPLLHDGRLLGTLSINTYDEAKQFTPEDAEVLELLAGVAAGVLASLQRTAELAAANQELKQARDDAHYQALHDGLTGLPNRVLLDDRLEQAILRGERDRAGLALLVLDLDRFKDVNDTLGHHTGDELLQQVASRLRTVVRASDTVARLGGDEFAIVLPTAADATVATELARKIVETVEQPYGVADHHVSVGASIGVAMYPEHGGDPKTLLRRADVAMYVAKRAGGGSTVYSSDQDANDPGQLELVGDLRDAIETNQLVLHYQPKLSLRSGECVRVEALVRWHHPKRGLVAPDQFIPLAERTGLIKPLTKWVLATAVNQCRAWRDSGVDMPVAVNLSVRNLHDPELAGYISGLLWTAGLPASSLKVEITESAIMTDPTRALETLGRIRELGVEVSIDDFGTGHSSLAYLKHMPVAEIKLDRSFVRDMQLNDNDFAIVRSTVELAHQLGLRVVAEGVEDRATWDLLLEMQCDLAQGYYMSRPLPATDFQSWLVSQARRAARAA
jgi:diguanylate cyclase (GGDEF)-like protein